jgi:nicotinate-nucleotide adenylyltransferase
MKVGLFGGTFDPIHLGHLIVAEFAREFLALDELTFVPAGDPWQKQDRDVTPAAIRVEMVRRAIASNRQFGLDLIEVERAGPSYSAETVAAIRGRLGYDDELFFLVGEDAARGIPTWEEPERLLANCMLAILQRPEDHDENFRVEGARQVFVPGPLIEISSSTIRDRIRAGRSVRYLLPPGVESLIAERRLYR